MFELISTALGAILGGGATGLFGIAIQRFFDFKKAQSDIQVIKLNLENAITLAKLESQRSTRVAEVEAESVVVRATMDAEARADEADAMRYTESLKHDRATYISAEVLKQSGMARILMATVDFLRGITRPFLTLYLVVISHQMFFWAKDLADARGSLLTAEMVQGILVQITGTVLYLAVTAVVWWFGSRSSSTK